MQDLYNDDYNPVKRRYDEIYVGVCGGEIISEDNFVHVWVSNSGSGGLKKFFINRQMSPIPTMHVKCEICNARKWMGELEWDELSEIK